MKDQQVSMTTCKGVTVKQRYIGTMCLILTDDANINHQYDIPNCIYDPSSPIDIIGIPVISAHFNDVASALDAVIEDDGSTILSSGCRSHLKWDNGKHHRYFNHPDIQLRLYQGTNYFSYFCSLIQKFTTTK